MQSRVVLAAVVLAVGALNACGTDGDRGSISTVASTAESTAESTITTEAPTDLAGDPTDALDATVICERLSVASVTADTGLDITRANPDDSSTPQCAYEYTSDTGGVSNLTVASMRPEDVGGLTGSEAFDFVVSINEAVAGNDADIQAVSAGDAAIRISSSAVHLGVVQVGDRVLTLIIPGADVAPDAVDRLIATMATTLD